MNDAAPPSHQPDWDAVFKAAAAGAPRTIFAAPRSPRDTFQKLADACRELGVDEWDLYGAGGAVTQLEDEVAALAGTQDAAYFPSGIMAQQAALRAHTDRTGNPRVALPDLSHLLVHEEDGPRLLHGFDYEYLTVGARLPEAAGLDALSSPPGAVLIELPLRDAGCELPTWEQLERFAQACRERSIPLHIDGARLWESVSFLGKDLDQIVALADTTYLSFYKGLGSTAGSILVGDTGTLAQARLWRRRLGGTVFRTTAEAVGALVGLREALPQIPRWVQWAQALAEQLPERFAPRPSPPHTNQFLLYAQGDPERTNQAVAEAITETGVAFSRVWKPTETPGMMVTELAIGSGSAEVSPEEAAQLLSAVVRG